MTTLGVDVIRLYCGSIGAEKVGVVGKSTAKIDTVMMCFRTVKFSAGIAIS